MRERIVVVFFFLVLSRHSFCPQYLIQSQRYRKPPIQARLVNQCGEVVRKEEETHTLQRKQKRIKAKSKLKKPLKTRRKDEQTGRRRKEYFYEYFTPAWRRMRERHRWLGQGREGGWRYMRGTVSERCPRGVESLAVCLETKIFFFYPDSNGRE